MKTVKLLVFAAIGGVIITLLTGLAQNSPEMLVGAVWYGYPLAWLVRLVVAPEYFPYVVRPLRLIADLLFWAIMATIVLFTYTRIRKPTTPSDSQPKPSASAD